MTDQKRDESMTLYLLSPTALGDERRCTAQPGLDEPEALNAEYWSGVFGDLYRDTLTKLKAAEQTIAEQKARIEELESEFEFMRSVARKAVKGIGEIVVWREQCNELDKSNHDDPRNFGNVEDTWELLESFAGGLEFELTEEIESL
jgi:hypothetical protein